LNPCAFSREAVPWRASFRRTRINEPIQLSRLLAERRAEILERWTQRIGAEHPDKELSRGELRDHLPRFFDEVLVALHAEEALGGPWGSAPASWI
jgi:hypothetical protein